MPQLIPSKPSILEGGGGLLFAPGVLAVAGAAPGVLDPGVAVGPPVVPGFGAVPGAAVGVAAGRLGVAAGLVGAGVGVVAGGRPAWAQSRVVAAARTASIARVFTVDYRAFSGKA